MTKNGYIISKIVALAAHMYCTAKYISMFAVTVRIIVITNKVQSILESGVISFDDGA